MIILSFDTGYNLAWSIVDTEKAELIEYGLYKIQGKQTYERFCDATKLYIEHLNSTLKRIKVDKVLIELPQFYGDKKSVISMKRGNLTYVYASAFIIFNTLNHDNKHFITPKSWKGQLKKRPTEKRVIIILKDQLKGILKMSETKREHLIDSIGIGLSQNKKLWSLL